MASGWRAGVLGAARAIGAEPRLRQAQRLLMSREQRRNTRDDANLDLVLSLTLPSDANCIDVGANVGTVLRTFVRLAPEGRHLAFEPLPELAEELRRAHPGVDVRCAAVADAAGTRVFRRVVGAHTRSGFHEDGYAAGPTEDLEVDVQVLDDVVPADRRIDVIKIDVEGAELEVLRGARGILTAHRPIVVLEHGGPPATSRAVHELLCGEVGLRAFDMDGNGPLDLAGFLAVVAGGNHWNFVFHR